MISSAVASSFSAVARLFSIKAADWESLGEYVVLIAGIALVLGLVGEYPECETWKKSVWYRAAKRAVIAGVFFEIVGGYGVFIMSRRVQQATDGAIRVQIVAQRAILDQLVPRSIKEPEAKALIAAFKGKTASITIFTEPNPDWETIEYSGDIQYWLWKAGVGVERATLRGQFSRAGAWPLFGTTVFCKTGTPELETKARLAQQITSILKLKPGNFMAYINVAPSFPDMPDNAVIVLPKMPAFARPGIEYIPPGGSWIPPERPRSWVGEWPPRAAWELEEAPDEKLVAAPAVPSAPE